MDRLDRLGVTVHVRAAVERITSAGRGFHARRRTSRELRADSVVLAGTVEPDTALFDALVTALPEGRARRRRLQRPRPYP